MRQRLLALLLPVVALTACARHPAVTDAELVAVVIQHIRTTDTANQAAVAKPLFVGTPGDFDALPMQWYRDPPSAWLDRFPAISPSLQPFSSARISSDGRITDASDSPSSMLLLISTVHIHSRDSASVDIGFVSHAGGGHGHTSYLRRERGVWRVTGAAGGWNS